MTCPKCGNFIRQGDILCSKCNYPVAMMSGETSSSEREPIQEIQQIKVAHIEPKEEIQSPMMPVKTPPIISKGNNKNTYSNYGEGKKAITSFKFIFPIVVGVIAVMLVASGVFAFIKLFVSEKKEQIELGQITAYQIEFNDFLYELSDDLTYHKENNKKTLYISDSNFTWEMSVQVIDATYSSVRSRKASLKSYFRSLNYEVSEIVEAKYGSSTYLILEAKKNNKNYLLAVTKAGDSSKCFGISIFNDKNDIDYTYLEKVSDILSNAKYQKDKATNENKIDFDFENALK